MTGTIAQDNTTIIKERLSICLSFDYLCKLFRNVFSYLGNKKILLINENTM